MSLGTFVESTVYDEAVHGQHPPLVNVLAIVELADVQYG